MSNNNLSNQNLNIEEGSVTFWVKEGKVNWSDNNFIPLLELNKNGNSIFIIKDSDNRLKFSHVAIGYGRTDVEYDVSGLMSDKAHFIVATWSIPNKKISLFMDGELAKESDIKY